MSYLSGVAAYPRPWGRWIALALALVLPLVLAGFLGLAVALGSLQLTLIAAGAVAGVLLLFVPTSSIVYLLLALAYFGVGLVMYYAKVMQAHWLLYGLCLFLWMKLPIDAIALHRRQQRMPPSLLGVMLGLYFLIALLSTLVNETSMLYALVGARNYLFVWSVAFVIASGVLNHDQMQRCFWFFLVIAALQLPFAVQQHFVNFARSGNWDAVVGTFGGNPEGGGGSGQMALFAAFSMGLAAALWKHSQLSARHAMVLMTLVTATLMLAEVKAFFVFAPLMMLCVLLRELKNRPGWTLGVLVLTGSFLGAMLTYYQHTYFAPSAAAAPGSGLSDYVDYAIGADTKLANNINRYTGEVSRVGAPLIWLEEGDVGGAHAPWIGHGMRASRSSPTLGKGDAAKHFSFSLTTSAVTALLWDIGALGFLTFLSILVIALVNAWRLSKDERIPIFHRATLEALVGAFVLALVSLPYNDALVDGHVLQVFYAFVVGYVMYWQRWTAAHSGSLHPQSAVT